MRITSPWLARGFAHGFALPLAWLLPVHGLLFAFHRSHVDLILRGHPGDGGPWLDRPNGTPLGIAVGILLAGGILGDAARRWVLSWTTRPDGRLDLFWNGLACGTTLYLALRQVGSAMQWWNAPVDAEVFRWALFLATSAWIASRTARDVLGTSSKAPGAMLAIGLTAAFGGGCWMSERFPELQAWQARRSALRTGDPTDYAHWILRTGDTAVQNRIRLLAWEDLQRNPTSDRARRYLVELDSLAPFRDSAELWANDTTADFAKVEGGGER